MNRRILILNVGLSGVNKYLFSQLAKKGWKFTIIDVPIPKICRLWAMISTFSPNLKTWKKKFSRKYARLIKSSWTFLSRTRYCEKKIKNLGGRFDVIFQISGMFAPSRDFNEINIPYVTFNDYTMILSKKYPDWMPSVSQVKMWLKLEKNLYKNATFIFTTSENTRRSIIEDYNIGSEKVINTGYGITIDDIPEISRDIDTKTILFIGKDFRRKGGYVLLDAFQKAREKMKEAKLVIVGPNKEIFDISMPGVVFLGSIEDRSAIKKLYEQAMVFVMPSLCEPFGLVFLEAMGHKLPCIGTTVDAIPEIIEDGKTGYLVPSGDVETLADRILILLGNPELSQKMGANGYELLKLKFNWENVGNLIDHYLAKCL